MIRGSCLCGGVRYAIDGDLGPVALCHCGTLALLLSRVRLAALREMAEMSDHVRIRLGLLDDDPGVRPQYHWAVNFKAPWWDISDDRPQLAQKP